MRPADSGGADATGPRVVKNPYENVNWDRVIPWNANLHSHTRNYAEAGYHILAITDHDNYHTMQPGERETAPTHETTWPWTRWIDEEPSQIWERDGVETSAFFPGLGERGMLAVRGNELSSEPHIVSLFNPCGFTGGPPQKRENPLTTDRRTLFPDADHDRERLACVEEAGGLSYRAHPAYYVPGGRWAGRFNWDESLEYFGGLITEFDSLLGIEFQMLVEPRGSQREVEEPQGPQHCNREVML